MEKESSSPSMSILLSITQVVLIKIPFSLILLAYHTTLHSIKSVIRNICKVFKWSSPLANQSRLNGKTIVITGTGSGLGRQLAQDITKHCLKNVSPPTIVCVDVMAKENEQTVRMIKELGGEGYAYESDLSDRNSTYQTFSQIVQDFGGVDVLVNNAGIVNGNSLCETSDDKIEKVFHVNTISHFWTVKSVLPHMLEKNEGMIVTISSVAGLVASTNLSDYTASKFAAIGFHQSLQAEMDQLSKSSKKNGVKCLLVCPYFTNTGMFKGVKTRIIPELNTSDVSQSILDSMLHEDTELIIPTWIGFVSRISQILPQQVVLYLAEVFEIHDAMSNFEGR